MLSAVTLTQEESVIVAIANSAPEALLQYWRILSQKISAYGQVSLATTNLLVRAARNGT